MSEFRETRIRVSGVAHVVRTERGRGTVAKMEAAHTKAVKAVLEDAVKYAADWMHAEAMAHLTTTDYPDPEGWGPSGVGMGEWQRAKDIAHEEKRYAELPKSRFHFPRSNWDDARKGWPKVRFTDKPPAGLTEIEPGHWVDDQAGVSA